jgi:hypothetical protein
MSALPPIATELMRRNELTRCANSVLTRRSKRFWLTSYQVSAGWWRDYEGSRYSAFGVRWYALRRAGKLLASFKLETNRSGIDGREPLLQPSMPWRFLVDIPICSLGAT